jgi:small subunit ribosomal protein S2
MTAQMGAAGVDLGALEEAPVEEVLEDAVAEDAAS